MVFKKDLTPLSKKGTVTKHSGKGSTLQRTRPGETESVTGGGSLGRAMNRYPANPQPAPAPTTAPPLGGPPMGPTPMGPPLPDDAA